MYIDFFLLLFQLLDEKKLQTTENLYKDFETAQKAGKM
jgi:hypothetical protein